MKIDAKFSLKIGPDGGVTDNVCGLFWVHLKHVSESNKWIVIPEATKQVHISKIEFHSE